MPCPSRLRPGPLNESSSEHATRAIELADGRPSPFLVAALYQPLRGRRRAACGADVFLSQAEVTAPLAHERA